MSTIRKPYYTILDEATGTVTGDAIALSNGNFTTQLIATTTSGTVDYSVTIQASNNNTDWGELFNFAATGAASGVTELYKPPSPLNYAWIRAVVITLTGTGAKATVIIS